MPKPALPDFLLEGDEPGPLEFGGLAEKFSLGAVPPLDHFDEASVPLPESYGTGKLFLTARDPHWLYAHWDFSREEQFRHNARSVDRHLILRVHPAAAPQAPGAEYHVHPESKYWFVHVERAGEIYSTELGYYQQSDHQWHSLAVSAPQRTPPDNISTDATVKFATIPVELSFETMLAWLRDMDAEDNPQGTPLAHTVDRIRARARAYFPKDSSAGGWTADQDAALAGHIATARTREDLPGSAEFGAAPVEREWPELRFDLETGEAQPLPVSSPVSSFLGEGPKDFWLSVNAELIVYGATEPDATVTVAGQETPLRPDGTFRLRFALPDGKYELPISAVAADGTEARAVELRFARATEVCGEVTAAPQEPDLSAPPGQQ